MYLLIVLYLLCIIYGLISLTQSLFDFKIIDLERSNCYHIFSRVRSLK